MIKSLSYLSYAIVSFIFLYGCTTPQRIPASDPGGLKTHIGHGGMVMNTPQATEAECLSNPAGAPTTEVSSAQQNIINGIVSNRGHRLQHALWHAMRSGLPTKLDSQVYNAYGQVWKEVHSYCPAPTQDSTASTYNAVGEDFLFMHHEMISDVRGALIAAHLPCVAAWPGVPNPASFPIPDADPNAGQSSSKSTYTYHQLETWDSSLQNNKWLSGMSLSQLGMAAELSVHNNLHMRYATNQPPAGFGGAERTGGAPIPYNGQFPAKWVYDNTAYNWLADPYGAALNPYFWMIHGYVDHLIELWLAAHGLKTVSLKCDGTPGCYQWKGVWIGSLPDTYGPDIVASHHSKFNRTPAFAASENTDDTSTQKFNQDRINKQWLGVIGGPPGYERTEGGKKEAPTAPLPSDPFEYAVQQVNCGAN